MKNSVKNNQWFYALKWRCPFWLLLFLPLFLCSSCLQENDCLSDRVCLTFEGDLHLYADGSPVAGAWVYIAWGKPCCGGIETVAGIDSIRSDEKGHYQITISHDRDTLQYTYIPFVKGVSLLFRPVPPPAYEGAQEWITYDYSGFNIVPATPDIPLDASESYETGFILIPAGTISLQTNSDLVSPGDTLMSWLTSPGISSPQDGNPVISGFGYNGDGQAHFRDIAAVANQPNILTTEIRGAGGILSSRNDTIYLSQGERLVWGL